MSGQISRRKLLAGAAGLAGLGVAGAAGFWGPRLIAPGQPGHMLTSEVPVPPPYQVPLPIPRVLTPSRTDAGTDYYEITQRVARQTILPGMSTPLWTYDGTFPGPTIVSRSGRRAVIRHRNELPRPVSVHLHGGRTPAASDGYPTDLILPVGTASPAGSMPVDDPHANVVAGERDYTYPFEQRAATLWYHDHRMDFSAPQIWRGLAGFHLVHDDEEAALPLPAGDRDLPLMLTDRAFAADGTLLYPSLDPTLQHTKGVTTPYMNGVTGDVILVNGAPWPVLAADAVRYRLRFLNASNARNYRLALNPPPPSGGGLVQIGSDGGLLAQPIAHDQLDIAPAERFDVVVDLSRYQPGTRVEIVNLLGAGPTARVMLIQVGSRATDQSHIPDRLSAIEPLQRREATVTRSALFQLKGDAWCINDLPFDPTRADATPSLGDTEIWRFVSDFAHPIHLHLVHFQVLSRNDEEPGPYDHGWKDTVDLKPAQSIEIITRFDGYPGRYLFHCHNLEHEDMAMMANFVTT